MKDVSFDEYLGLFNSYKTQITQLIEHVKRHDQQIITFSKQKSYIYDSLDTLFTDSVHSCSEMVVRGKQANDHYLLRAIPIASQYMKTAKDILDDVLRECERITAFNNMRKDAVKEFVYYQTKVGEILKNKEDCYNRNKVFKQQEKLDRNMIKLDDAKEAYVKANDISTDVMYQMLVARYDHIQGAIIALLASERVLFRGALDTLEVTCNGDIDGVIDGNAHLENYVENMQHYPHPTPSSSQYHPAVNEVVLRTSNDREYGSFSGY